MMIKSAFGFIFLVAIGFCSTAQSTHAVTISYINPESFSFTKNWAYPWYTLKDNNGKWTSGIVDIDLAKDTVHLYFTANCETNVQGGYKIRYCKAKKTTKGIKIVFADGEPAYASEFYISVENNRIKFTPEIVYPVIGDKLVYKTTKAKLVLNKIAINEDKQIGGYIDAVFNETDTLRKVVRHYYFRGYFKTPITN